MELTPDSILQDFSRKYIDKNYAIDQLISLIDNSNDEAIRLRALEILQEIGIVNEEVFKFLENLFISDVDAKVRLCAAIYLKKNFINKTLSLMKWAINHETDYKCVIFAIKTLVELNTFASKKLIIENIKKIKNVKYLDDNKRIENNKYRKAISFLIKSHKIKKLSHTDLAEILINYLTISELTKKFYSVYFELEHYLVSKLDLADVEYEVRGWKADFKNNIKNLSEITGLENLTHLTHLNISNNQIKNIQSLIQLKNLTHLYLSNNQIQNLDNLEYIKQIPNLKYIDLAGNQITNYISPDNVVNLEINIRKYFH